MSNLDKLYNEIGQTLFSLFPDKASSMDYYAQVFDDSNEYSATYTINGEVKGFQFSKAPEYASDLIYKFEELRSNEIFANNPWTHCHFYISENGEFSIDFAYIDEDDSYPNLYLKGVSDLARDEISQYYIPETHWVEQKKKYNKG